MLKSNINISDAFTDFDKKEREKNCRVLKL